MLPNNCLNNANNNNNNVSASGDVKHKLKTSTVFGAELRKLSNVSTLFKELKRKIADSNG